MNSKAVQPQLYQVDFTKQKAGKQFAKSKRRVTWKFGFANEQAIAEGATGVECRGVEHEVCLVWSINSGKRFVTFDGKDVHYSIAPRDTKFECCWQVKDGPFMKIVGHATAPATGKPPGWKMFDLFLNGLSYFDFAKMYELGPAKRGYITPATEPKRLTNVDRYENHYPKEEYSLHQKDVEERSPYENTTNQQTHNDEHETAPKIDLLENVEDKAPEGDLLDLTMEPTLTTSTTSDILADDFPSYEATSFIPTNTITQVDPFAPGYVAPPPTKNYTNVSNEILNAYGSSQEAKQPPLTIEYPSSNDNHRSAIDLNVGPDSLRDEKLYGNVSLGMPSLEESSTSSPCTSEEQEPWEKHISGFEDSLKKLVNFDDITSAPESLQLSSLTMKPTESQRKTNKKSTPLPPAANTWSGASLSQIQAVKQTSVKSESVMKSYPSQIAQPGAMVPYGAQPNQNQSLPPQGTGFGAGAYMGYNQSNSGYSMGYNQSYTRRY